MIDEKKLINEIKYAINSDKYDGYKPAAVLCEVYDMIQEQLKVGEWIPCSERLPKTKGNYLVTVTDYDGRHIEIGYFDPNDLYDVDFWSTGVDIVAWQPLPEPWEGAEDEKKIILNPMRFVM